MNVRIYWAGPLFSEAELEWNKNCVSKLRANGFEVDLPQEMNEKFDKTEEGWQRAIFEDDKSTIERTDIVVAVTDGADMDAGTAWECGYAYALGIPLVLLHTDMRSFTADERMNLMIAESADAIVSSFDELLEWLSVVDDAFTEYALSKGYSFRRWLVRRSQQQCQSG